MGGPLTGGADGAGAAPGGTAVTAVLPRIPGPGEAALGGEELPESPFRGTRGRVLVVEGGDGRGVRRLLPPRGAAPAGGGLSAVLAAISPQILLAADSVDSVHLPSASDPQTVLAHLRAAARHPGPLLIHLGGHLLAERRTGLLHVALRDTRPSALRTDALPWNAVAEQLRMRPLEWGTLVIADLSADPKVMPMLRTVPCPLAAGLPLWAAVNPDPQQVGLFTRALVEALHGGRPGAGPGLTPEQIQYQVHSVLRPDAVVVSAHDPHHVVFRNTARRVLEPGGEALPAPSPDRAYGAGTALPPGAPPMPAAPPTVHLAAPPVATTATAATTAPTGPEAPGRPEPVVPDPLAAYRDAVARIVGAADQGEHARAVALSVELEREVIVEHGPDAPASLQVRQVRAHVARLAGYQAGAAGLYRDVALRLQRQAGPDDPETLQAASNAEACWRAIEDEDEAIRVGAEIVAMRQAVPGPDARRLRAAERHLARLRGPAHVAEPEHQEEDAANSPGLLGAVDDPSATETVPPTEETAVLPRITPAAPDWIPDEEPVYASPDEPDTPAS
jgi:hypothetical protein